MPAALAAPVPDVRINNVEILNDKIAVFFIVARMMASLLQLHNPELSQYAAPGLPPS
jgi:hypothetical protein